MRFSVDYREQDAGWVETETDSRGMHFRAESTVRTRTVLRLYGLTGAKPLLIGVLEPQDGVLRLERRLTLEMLRAAGINEPPHKYYLDDGQPGCKPAEPTGPAITAFAQTGDPLLDGLIASGEASCDAEEDGWTVRIPFAAGDAQPLNFALSACTLERADERLTAILRKEKSP